MPKAPTPPRKRTTLTHKELKFIEGLAEGKSNIDAYLGAGYTGKRNSASSGAADLLKRAPVHAALVDAHKQAVKRLGVTYLEVLAEAWSIAIDTDIIPSARVSALQLIAKTMPEFAERFEHGGVAGVIPAAFLALDSEALREMMALNAPPPRIEAPSIAVESKAVADDA
jgi:hypothetical protein